MKNKIRYGGTYYNKEIFELIPFNSKVLDVGCNTGYLGKDLIEKKKCYVFGIDYSKTAIDVAKKYLNKVKVVNLEKYSNNINDKFDVIIFADVLEHLKFPEKTLNIYKKLLNPNGVILASIPNIANINTRLKLLLGNWNYTDSGILDETHLKFFTKKTILKMFKNAKLNVKLMRHTVGCKFLILRYFKIFKTIRSLLCKINPKLFALQFIIVAENT